MNISARVLSYQYKSKGPATILSFFQSFWRGICEILFVNSGETLTTKKSDLLPELSMMERLKTGEIDAAELFLVRNMA